MVLILISLPMHHELEKGQTNDNLMFLTRPKLHLSSTQASYI